MFAKYILTLVLVQQLYSQVTDQLRNVTILQGVNYPTIGNNPFGTGFCAYDEITDLIYCGGGSTGTRNVYSFDGSSFTLVPTATLQPEFFLFEMYGDTENILNGVIYVRSFNIQTGYNMIFAYNIIEQTSTLINVGTWSANTLTWANNGIDTLYMIESIDTRPRFWWFNTTTQELKQGNRVKTSQSNFQGHTCLKLYNNKLYALGNFQPLGGDVPRYLDLNDINGTWVKTNPTGVNFTIGVTGCHLTENGYIYQWGGYANDGSTHPIITAYSINDNHIFTSNIQMPLGPNEPSAYGGITWVTYKAVSLHDTLYLISPDSNHSILIAHFGSLSPTLSPVPMPTLPTDNPTMIPSVNPSMNPSQNPSTTPTRTPSDTSPGPSQYPSDSPTPQPTESPSNSPSNKPTMRPTTNPSEMPSNYPTNRPSESPTNYPTPNLECNYTSGEYTVDWDSEFESTITSNVQSIVTSSQTINSDGILEIKITAIADYIVDAMYQGNNVGVTYVLNTEEFDGSSLLGIESTACENRIADDFMNLTFNEYWTYTITPEGDEFPGNDGLGMIYPQSNWNMTLTGDDAPCDSVMWTQTFEFEDLYYDCGFELIETDEEIQLSGTFFLTLVSPSALFYPSLSDSGEYYIKQIQAHVVTISFAKSYTLKTLSESVNLYGVQIIGGTFDAEFNLFTLTLYSYVPNYLQIDGITTFKSFINDTTVWDINEDDSYDPNECLFRDSYRCWQKFTITTTVDECISDGFSDIFSILTSLDCYDSDDLSNNDSLCYTFMEDAQTNNVLIGSVELEFDLVCDENAYNQDFSAGASLIFVEDSSFTSEDNDPVYTYGDTVYVELEIDDNLDSYDLIGLRLVSATLCTSDDGSITSCSDASVNIFDVYDMIADSTINFMVLGGLNNTLGLQISFNIPVISQDYICIELVVELTILNNFGPLRRVLLSNSMNSFENFAATARNIPQENIKVIPDKDSNNKLNDNNMFIVIGVAALSVILVAGGAYLLVKKYKNSQSKYEEVVEMQIKNTKDEFEGLVE